LYAQTNSLSATLIKKGDETLKFSRNSKHELVIFRESTRGKKREKRTVWTPLIFIFSFSPFSSLGPILCGFGLITVKIKDKI
jgi:hypothetical protein